MKTATMFAIALCTATMVALIPGEERDDFDFHEKHPAGIASLIRVLAHPESYHKRRIQVTGVLCTEFEGEALYIDPFGYDHRIAESSVWLTFRGKDQKELEKWRGLEGKPVRIVGTFDGKKFGHFNLFGGTIEVESVSERRNFTKQPAGKQGG